MTLKIRYILLAIILPFSIKGQYSYQWTKFFGSDTLLEATSIGYTTSGDIIIAGIIRNNGTHTLIQKITQQGEILWTKSISHHKTAVPSKIIVMPDSSIIIAGYMLDWEENNENVWLAKLDSNGTLLWERFFFQFGYSYATDIKPTPDNGFVISANKFNPTDNSFDWLILKTNSLGLLKWYKTSGTPYNDNINALAVLPNNTYAVAGYVSVNNGAQKIMAISIYDSLGQEISYNEFKNLGFSEAMDITATRDTSLIITGYTIDSLYKHDIVVIKLNKQADTLWQKTFKMPFRQIPFSIIEAYDNTYVLAYNLLTGEIPYSDIGILQLDPNGNIIFSRLIRRSSDDFIAQLVEQPDNSLALLATNFVIGQGWVISLSKWNSLLTSDMWFMFPRKKVIAINQNHINIKACIKSYMKPSQVVVYHNNSIVDTITNFTLLQNRHCPFAMNIDIKLSLGINVIKFETTDYKGFKFIRKRVIIYIPLPNKTW